MNSFTSENVEGSSPFLPQDVLSALHQLTFHSVVMTLPLYVTAVHGLTHEIEFLLYNLGHRTLMFFMLLVESRYSEEADPFFPFTLGDHFLSFFERCVSRCKLSWTSLVCFYNVRMFVKLRDSQRRCQCAPGSGAVVRNLSSALNETCRMCCMLVLLVHVKLASGFGARLEGTFPWQHFGRHSSLLLVSLQMQILGKRLNDHLFLDALSCLSNGRVLLEDMAGHGRDDQLKRILPRCVAQGMCTISASMLS